MNIALLQSRTRRHEVVFPRQLSVWLHQQHTKMTHKAVSLLYYGNRDHSNSIRACQKIEDYRSIAGEYKDTITEFLAKYHFDND
jgi:chromosomal replication initiation ATPase DnaA